MVKGESVPTKDVAKEKATAGEVLLDRSMRRGYPSDLDITNRDRPAVVQFDNLGLHARGQAFEGNRTISGWQDKSGLGIEREQRKQSFCIEMVGMVVAARDEVQDTKCPQSRGLNHAFGPSRCRNFAS